MRFVNLNYCEWCGSLLDSTSSICKCAEGKFVFGPVTYVYNKDGGYTVDNGTNGKVVPLWVFNRMKEEREERKLRNEV